MANTYIYDLSDTWNNGSTTFNGIKIDVTDTLSAADSKLFDLQLGSVTRYHVGKRGNMYANVGLDNAESDNGLQLDLNWDTSANTSGIRVNLVDTASGTGSKLVDLYVAGSPAFSINKDGSTDIFNSYTNDSNYEKATIEFDTNAFEINTSAAGTGTRRNIKMSAPEIDMDQSVVHNTLNKLNNVSTSTYMLTNSDSGKIIAVSNAANVSVTVSNTLPIGFSTTLLQTGAGRIEFVADTGLTLNQADSYTKTRKQFATATITVYDTVTAALHGELE